MKIGLLTEIINYHSGARAPLEIAKYLAKIGHQTTVYAYNFRQDRETKADLLKSGVSIVVIKKPNILYFGKYLGAVSLFKILKKHHPEILVFSGTLPFFWAGKLSGIPIVRVYQGTQFDASLEKKIPGQELNFFEKFLNKIANYYIYLVDFLIFRLADGITAVSKFAANEGRKLYWRKVDRVIYNGTTNLPWLKNSPEKVKNQVEIISVSRITPYKGFHQIIEAIKKTKSNKKIAFTIVGSQPKKGYLNYLKKLGEKNLRIVLDPSDSELARFYQQSDIYVTADRYLFFGLPICEAGYFAKPTIAMNFAAAAELVQHGKTGFVAKNIEEFSIYIQRLVNQPQLRKKMGKAAQKRTNQLFNWNKAVQYYNDFFKLILSRKKGKNNNFSVLGLIILFGLILRILFLTQHDFWFDEAFSYFVSRQNLLSLTLATAADNHPPLFYYLLHFWMKITSQTVIAQRFLSLVFGVLSIPAIFWLGRSLLGRQAGFLSSLFLAISPLMIYYSTETRMYSLSVFLVLMVVIFFQRFILKPSFGRSLGLIISFTLALYTNYYTYLLFLPLNLVFLFKRKNWFKFAICQVFVFVLVSPWLVIFSQNSHPEIFAQNLTVALPATFASFVLGGTGVVSLRKFFSTEITKAVVAVFTISILFFGVIFSKIFFQLKNNSKLIFPLIFLISPLVLLAFLSFFKPVFSVRGTIILAPFFYLLLATSIASFRQCSYRIVISLTILLLLSIYLIQITQNQFKGPPLAITASQTKNFEPIAHMSILTYYPFRYYQGDKTTNFLISQNPLTQKTQTIISGQTNDWQNLPEKFVLVETNNGGDLGKIANLKRQILERYQILKIKNFGEITIVFLKK